MSQTKAVLHTPPARASDKVGKKTVFLNSQSSRRAAHAFAAPFWSQLGR